MPVSPEIQHLIALGVAKTIEDAATFRLGVGEVSESDVEDIIGQMAVELFDGQVTMCVQSEPHEPDVYVSIYEAPILHGVRLRLDYDGKHEGGLRAIVTIYDE